MVLTGELEKRSWGKSRSVQNHFRSQSQNLLPTILKSPPHNLKISFSQSLITPTIYPLTMLTMGFSLALEFQLKELLFGRGLIYIDQRQKMMWVFTSLGVNCQALQPIWLGNCNHEDNDKDTDKDYVFDNYEEKQTQIKKIRQNETASANFCNDLNIFLSFIRPFYARKKPTINILTIC